MTSIQLTEQNWFNLYKQNKQLLDKTYDELVQSQNDIKQWRNYAEKMKLLLNSQKQNSSSFSTMDLQNQIEVQKNLNLILQQKLDELEQINQKQRMELLETRDNLTLQQAYELKYNQILAELTKVHSKLLLEYEIKISLKKQSEDICSDYERQIGILEKQIKNYMERDNDFSLRDKILNQKLETLKIEINQQHIANATLIKEICLKDSEIEENKQIINEQIEQISNKNDEILQLQNEIQILNDAIKEKSQLIALSQQKQPKVEEASTPVKEKDKEETPKNIPEQITEDEQEQPDTVQDQELVSKKQEIQVKKQQISLQKQFENQLEDSSDKQSNDYVAQQNQSAEASDSQQQLSQKDIRDDVVDQQSSESEESNSKSKKLFGMKKKKDVKDDVVDQQSSESEESNSKSKKLFGMKKKKDVKDDIIILKKPDMDDPKNFTEIPVPVVIKQEDIIQPLTLENMPVKTKKPRTIAPIRRKQPETERLQPSIAITKQ